MNNPYYQEGGQTIYLGDNRDILPDLPKVDLVLTDPPYGIGHIMHGGIETGHWNQLSDGNSWDSVAPDMVDIVPMGTVVIIWGGNYFVLPLSRCWLAWVKTNSVPTQSDMELAWSNMDKPSRIYKSPTGGSYKREHPTQKPLQLMKWCINQVGNANTILDPFMGSGTTLVAAKSLNRKAIGIEIEEKYCEIAAKRLQQSVMEMGI